MIVLLGLAGSGKSTQAALLSVRLGCLRLSIGDLLRANMGGEEAHKMLAGELIADELWLPLLEKEIERLKTREFILDGSPRTLNQAQWLVDKIQKYNIKLTGVVHLKASQEVVKQRLLARGRPDDNEGAINERFSEYEGRIVPILSYLREQGFTVHEINGEKPEPEVEKDIEKALGLDKQ